MAVIGFLVRQKPMPQSACVQVAVRSLILRMRSRVFLGASPAFAPAAVIRLSHSALIALPKKVRAEGQTSSLPTSARGTPSATLK